MNTETATTEQLTRGIALLRWTLEKNIPAELKKATNARRIAGLKKQRAEGLEELPKLEAELAKREGR